MIAAGPVGALFGAFMGHLYDAQPASLRRESRRNDAQAGSVEEAYFHCVFSVMGRLAKADGRVSETQIDAARAMMRELNLGERDIQLAMQLFRQGKDPEFPLDAQLAALAERCTDRRDLCRMLVQIQIQTALWGDGLSGASREVLVRVCRVLDVSAYELIQMEALLRMQARRPPRERAVNASLLQAYGALGVEHTAADEEVVRAYRRLMNQHHPDKLHAKGLPETAMLHAAEKTREIRRAYEVIRRARGLQ